MKTMYKQFSVVIFTVLLLAGIILGLGIDAARQKALRDLYLGQK